MALHVGSAYPHDGPLTVELQIAPPQCQRLADPHARRRHKLKQQPVTLGHDCQQHGELRVGQCAHVVVVLQLIGVERDAPLIVPRGQRGANRRVVADQALGGRGSQACTDRGEHAPHGRVGEVQRPLFKLQRRRRHLQPRGLRLAAPLRVTSPCSSSSHIHAMNCATWRKVICSSRNRPRKGIA
jgi:hypothetical protein